MQWLFKKYIQQGEQQMLAHVITKFETLFDDYYGQGKFTEANLITDFVAYLQDDYEGMSENDKSI